MLVVVQSGTVGKTSDCKPGSRYQAAQVRVELGLQVGPKLGQWATASQQTRYCARATALPTQGTPGRPRSLRGIDWLLRQRPCAAPRWFAWRCWLGWAAGG
jgi:hypothetical protein